MAGVELVAGWTGPLDFQLLADGAPQNLTGMAVEMLLKTSGGDIIDTSGDLALLDAPAGKVRFSPDPADLVATASPLVSRFKVTDGLGKVVFFPSGEPDDWKVRAPI